MSFSGIILRVTPYQDRGWILLLFSQEEGLIPCFLPISKKEGYGWVEPFIVVRGSKGERRGDLFPLKELVGEHWFWGLRERPEAVKALHSIRDRLVQVVEEEHPLPLVYLLLSKIIQELEKGADPKTMEALFLVKLALHEGVLDIDGLKEGAEKEWVKKAAATRNLVELPTIDQTLSLEILA